MVDVTQIRFRDIAEGERAERARLQDRLSQLEKIQKDRKHLSNDEGIEIKRIKEILEKIEEKGSKELCDPRFVGLRDLFNKEPGSGAGSGPILNGVLGIRLKNHDNGVLQGASSDGSTTHLPAGSVVLAALTIGLSMVDEVPPPPVEVQAAATYVRSGETAAETTTKQASTKPAPQNPERIVSSIDAPEYAEFSSRFFAQFGEAQSMFKLASLVLPLLAQEGDSDLDDKIPGAVDAAEFARVMRALRDKGVTTRELQLRRRINECLNGIQFVGGDGPVTELGIDLPDLEQATDSDIVPDNVRLMGPMICAAMFDELKAFQVVDKLVELFQHGMLPIGSGEPGKLLYKYWKDAPNRMSEGERKNFYSMTMGIPGGETSGMVNRDFNDLWLRFVSSVSSFIRQSEVDKLLRAAVPSTVSQQQVRKAARDLAANLSLHGYGMAYYAALDLQAQIRFMIQLLSDKDIRSAYGARDMWQVVDQVAVLELGGAKTSTRYRTLATCGAIITAWLANNVQRIMRPTVAIIDIDTVRSPPERPSGEKATTKPSDYDLVNACELWLADTATSDTRIDEMAQPREAPTMTSKPVQIPTIARDMLDGAGIGMGLGLSAARH